MDIFVSVEGGDKWVLPLWEDATVRTLRSAIASEAKLTRHHVIEGPEGPITEDEDIRSLCMGDTLRVFVRVTPLLSAEASLESQYRGFMIAVYYDRRKQCKRYLTEGLSPNGSRDYEIVMCAVRRGHNEILKMLLESGATASRMHDVSPLCVACAHRNMAAVQILLAHGALINEWSRDELSKRKDRAMTALEAALKHDAHDIAEYLIMAGADPKLISTKAVEMHFMRSAGTVPSLPPLESRMEKVGCAPCCIC
eukprot:TRINITY_DN37572_c0_g1_i2.p1 TRINITY_DN37572_c0_g1~~TRINITY_DN37572_c0_g1_i2.p1  ORF type:complete len:253 (+),score=65.65 TRINITY_DN37572_c0_g1_i2:392-1150(+)